MKKIIISGKHNNDMLNKTEKKALRQNIKYDEPLHDEQVKLINKYFFPMTIIFSLVCGQNWEQSYTAGNMDSEGIFMGGSEILNLETHKNLNF